MNEESRYLIQAIMDLGYALELCCTKTEQIRRKTAELQKTRCNESRLDILVDVIFDELDRKYIPKP